jgi:hypothetical protein
MMLNELALLGPRRVSNRAARYGDALRRLTRGGGLLMFVEPGTRKGYMHLMTLRERMEGLPILYPCPHMLPCPFWRGKVRNWCHAEVPLPGGFFFDRTLREQGGVDFAMREINMAALVVHNTGVHNTGSGRVEAPFSPQKGERVVSNPMPERKAGPKTKSASQPVQSGDSVVLICGADGRLHERPARTLANPGKGVRGSWIDGDGRGN